MTYVVPIILFSGAAIGQQYEVGANIGYGFYRNGTIFSDSGTAQAGIRNRFAAGIVLGDEFSNYVSGEFRYLYHDGHGFLQAPGVKADIQGQSVALTTELLCHFKKREQRWRPFLAGAPARRNISSPVRSRSHSRFRRLPASRRTMCGKSFSAWAEV
jgi:hypothetical protein